MFTKEMTAVTIVHVSVFLKLNSLTQGTKLIYLGFIEEELFFFLFY